MEANRPNRFQARTTNRCAQRDTRLRKTTGEPLSRSCELVFGLKNPVGVFRIEIKGNKQTLNLGVSHWRKTTAATSCSLQDPQRTGSIQLVWDFGRVQRQSLGPSERIRWGLMGYNTSVCWTISNSIEFRTLRIPAEGSTKEIWSEGCLMCF